MSSKIVQMILIAVCVSLLTGCGIRLKGTGAVPASNKRIYVSGIPAYSPFARELQNRVEVSGGVIANKVDEFDLHLHVLDQRRTRRELSLSQRGKANEYELTFEIVFEVVDKDNYQLMPEQTISITRDYFNQQLRVLGKANEEDTIWQEIYKTAVNNFLQRLNIAQQQPKAKEIESVTEQ